jgi:small subunit ribosomal protein S2
MNTATDVAEKPVERMYSAGAHFGLAKARRHPSARNYLHGTKDKYDIFDLEKTEEALSKAKEFAKKLGMEGKKLMFVGGKAESHKIVREAAVRVNAPFVIGRWIGGSVTNFAEIKKRVAKLQRLQNDKESGALSKYTKYERLHIDREIDKLTDMYEGLVGLGEKLPDALFVIDPRRESIAVQEAQSRKIPIIGLASSDCDLNELQYPIPANDAARRSIDFFVNEIAGAYEEGQREAPAKPARTTD